MINPQPSKPEEQSQTLGMPRVTVILTLWKRNYIEEQIEALLSQTVKPSEIWIYQCGDYVCTDRLMEKYDNLQLIKSSVNLKYFGRFSLAYYINTEYAWILDDDVIPSTTWIERCIQRSMIEPVIISCAGRRIPKHSLSSDHEIERDAHFFGDVSEGVGHSFCNQETIVDYGCGGWFLPTEWIKTFWQIPPSTLENAEDIHLSAACMLKSRAKTIVLRQLDITESGNIRVQYGRDQFSSWTSPGFEAARENVVNYLVKQFGWSPMLWKC
jgi:hypothetical protein